MTKLARPIIIVGTGRCGSTVFHRQLAQHPQVMWLAGFCDRYPSRPAWNRWAVSAIGNPLLRHLLGRKVQPGECYRFWDKYAYGFAEPCRDLVHTDLTPRVKRQVRAVFESMLTSRRNRLLLKLTGWPRVGYLDAMFEDARFVHLIRDGRAVASSLLHVNFWTGWYGPQGWRAGLLSAEDQAIWERHQRSFVALAALEWRIQMRAMEAARRSVDASRFLEITYETYCAEPLQTIRRVLEFADLSTSPEYERQLAATPIRSANEGWRAALTEAQQGVLEEILRDDLLRYGYDPAQPGRGALPAAG
jgi:hypothetical protein